MLNSIQLRRRFKTSRLLLTEKSEVHIPTIYEIPSVTLLLNMGFTLGQVWVEEHRTGQILLGMKIIHFAVLNK